MTQELFSRRELICGVLEYLIASASCASPLIEAANIPFLGSALRIVNQIFSLAQSVKSNKEDCQNLASRCLDLLYVIYDAVKRNDCKEETNKRLLENTGFLEQTLNSVMDTMKKINRTCLVCRIILNFDIKDRIQKRNSELDGALELFHLQNINDISLTDIKTNETVSQTREGFEEICEKISRIELEITKTNDNTTDLYLLERESPPKSQIFYGQEEFVEKAVSCIISKHPVRLPILGLGGIGKTSIASAITDHTSIHDTFSEHRYFINCSAFHSAIEMLRAMCQIIIGPDSSLKSGDTNILRSLLEFLKSTPKSLLVLDNFETVWDVEDQQGIKIILGCLFELDCLTLLITMRGSVPPEGFRWSNIMEDNVLHTSDLEDAKKTFLDIYPNMDRSEENILDLYALLTALDCVPLAVSIASQVASAESATPKEILANVSQYLETYRKDPNASIKASVSLSLNSHAVRLHPECIDVLKIIAYLPDGVTVDSVAEMTQYPNSKRLIAVLLTAALIHQEGNRFNTLSPIRLYIEDTFPLAVDAQQAIFEYYFRICADGSGLSTDDSLEVKARLSAEKTNCLKVLSNAIKSYKADNRHLKAIVDFSWFLYSTIPSLELLQLASEEFEACDDKLLVASYHRVLGEILRRQDKYKEATEVFAKANLEFNGIGDRGQAAHCLRRLGDIVFLEAHYEEARRMLEEANDIFNSIGERLGTALCLQKLGEVAQMQTDFEGARSTLLEAKDIFDGISNRFGAARCLQSLGDTMLAQKDYEHASITLSESKNISESIGDKLGAAHCLQSLGKIAREQKNYSEAKTMLSEAKDMFVSGGNRLGEARCIEDLGHTAMDCGEYDDAKRMLFQAKDRYEAIGSPELSRCQRRLDELTVLMGESTK